MTAAVDAETSEMESSMTKTDKTPWEKVTDQSYFKGVLGNMVALGCGPRRSDQAAIRFGNTGGGHAPNYQIELPGGEKRCFNGMGHKEASSGSDEFAPANLSVERFSYQDVEGMLSRLQSPK